MKDRKVAAALEAIENAIANIQSFDEGFDEPQESLQAALTELEIAKKELA